MRNSVQTLIISLLIILGNSCDDTSLPVVITAPITDVRSTSVLTGGTTVSTGEDRVLAQGICWSTQKSPTLSDNFLNDTIGLSSFSLIIGGLTPNTSYYVRAFATNSDGTAYGPDLRFATMGKNVVVLDGDSRTDGWNCEYRYPYIDLLSIQEPSFVFKTSFGGLSSFDLITRAPEQVDTKFSNAARLNIVVVWIGVNDIAINDQSSTTTYTNLVNYCNERRSKGWKVIICTEVSMKGNGSSGACDLVRIQYNEFINNAWNEFADGIADLAGNQKIGAIGAFQDVEYFCDGIHLTNAGTQIVATIINDAIDLLVSK